MNEPENLTQLLSRIQDGDEAASARVFELVYDELRRRADVQMRGERPGHTIQATALVHEAYLRLVGDTDPEWQNRAHFFSAAATAMRRILIDYARRRGARKRGGDAQRVPWDEVADLSEERLAEGLAIHEALEKLETLDPRKARIVELRFFAGLGIDQVAEVLDLSVRTVKREWQFIRAWLYREIGGVE